MKVLILISLLASQTMAFGSIISGLDLRTNKKIEVQQTKKKGTVYYFLSAWCPCSQGSFDHLNTLQKEYKNFDFVGFHSSVEVPKKDALDYFAKFKIDFPIIFDDEVVYADKFKAVKTPHIFVHDPNGKVLFQGGATNSRNPKNASKFYLKDALASLEKGETPKIKNAKTIGCYIQR